MMYIHLILFFLFFLRATCIYLNNFVFFKFTIGRPSMKKVEEVRLMKEAAELDTQNILKTEGTCCKVVEVVNTKPQLSLFDHEILMMSCWLSMHFQVEGKGEWTAYFQGQMILQRSRSHQWEKNSADWETSLTVIRQID